MALPALAAANINQSVDQLINHLLAIKNKTLDKTERTYKQ